MTADLLAALRQFQRYATATHNLLAQAEARVPNRVEAADRSGAIRVVLGGDGLPESIVVGADWQHRLTAAGFGAAVLEACQIAAGKRMTAWSQTLRADGLRVRADRLRDEPYTQSSAPVDPLPPDLRRRVDSARPRALEHLADDVLRAADRVAEFAETARFVATGTGADASKRLTVTVSNAGLMSCTAEPRWVTWQPGEGLTAALRQALRMARTELARASQGTVSTVGLDELFAEALAILNDLSR